MHSVEAAREYNKDDLAAPVLEHPAITDGSHNEPQEEEEEEEYAVQAIVGERVNEVIGIPMARN